MMNMDKGTLNKGTPNPNTLGSTNTNGIFAITLL